MESFYSWRTSWSRWPTTVQGLRLNILMFLFLLIAVIVVGVKGHAMKKVFLIIVLVVIVKIASVECQHEKQHIDRRVA
jgi:hypothetical protein